MIFNTRMARENWASKYQYDGETELQTFQRVARALAEVEYDYGATDDDVAKWYDAFLKTIVDFEPAPLGAKGEDIYVDIDGDTLQAVGLKATTGGRITANSGTDYAKATPWNCFINSPVSNAQITYKKNVPNMGETIDCLIETDETPDNLTNIFLSLLEAAETLKSEGGYGLNFGFIRPRGSLIKGVGIRHPGVVSYMELWDKMSAMIVKGDNDGYEDKLENHIKSETSDRVEKVMPRKGAMMAVLPVWHPDIEEFVRAKLEAGRLTKFNISVLVDDAFMHAVGANELYELRFNGKVYKEVRATALYDLIMESTYNRAEPGVLFFDNMNRNNPLIYLGPTTAANPCVTSDTWILTEEGPRQVNELIGKPFKAIVEGKTYPSNLSGFWHTGQKDVYTLTTSRGYQIRLTEDHPLRRVVDGVPYEEEWTEVGELKTGDTIRIANQREFVNWSGAGTYDEGWLIGSLIGDGTFKERESGLIQGCLDYWGPDRLYMVAEAERKLAKLGYSVDSRSTSEVMVRLTSKAVAELAARFGIEKGAKVQVTGLIHRSSSAFHKGFLAGLFDADGGIQQGNGGGINIKLSQSDEPLLREVQRMLMRFGIATRREAGPRELPDGKGNTSLYECKANHELIIGRDNITKYFQEIGFEEPSKTASLAEGLSDYKKGPYAETFVDTIDSIVLDGVEDVYDVTISEIHEFDANGIRVSNCGEIPGLSFLDQSYQPAPYLQPYMEGWDEHFIGSTTVCLLGSLNLTRFIKDDRSFNYDKYVKTIEVFTRMLDNVNDMGVVPLPAYAWAVKNIRQFGMGVNGLGSAMYMLGLRYGSDEAADFIQKLHEIKDEVTLKASALLAKEKGAFPMYTEAYLETPYFKDVCTASEGVKELVRKYGVRNAKRLTNPPLGNSSVICDLVSNGIEPVFSFGYERTIMTDVWPEGLNRDNVESILTEIQVGDATCWRGEYAGRVWYYEPHNRGLCFIDQCEDYGYSWLKENAPGDVESQMADKEADHFYMVTAMDLPVSDHVKMQAKVQESCDQSVSKTANLPKEYPFEGFKGLYMDAWKKGLVGFTTYREGIMENVLSSGGSPEKKVGDLLESLMEFGCTPVDAQITDGGVVVADVRLPDEFSNGPTHTIRREDNKYYMHLSYLPNDPSNPVALWIHSNDYKEGEFVTMNRAFRAITKLLLDKGVDSDLVLDQVDKIHDDAYHVKLGKVISMCMRHNISLPDIVGSLRDIEGDYIATTLTAVRKFLTQHIPDGTEATIASCANCGSENLIYEGGCDKCLDCGNSGC